MYTINAKSPMKCILNYWAKLSISSFEAGRMVGVNLFINNQIVMAIGRFKNHFTSRNSSGHSQLNLLIWTI
jgi:hypothetical protein